MIVELRNQQMLNSVCAVSCLLLATFPWVLSVPLWLKVVASSVAMVALLPHLSRKERLCALYLGPHDALSVAVSRKAPESRRLVKVRSLRVTRFYRCYIEMTLKLDDAREVSALVFPGVCTPEAMWHLRRFLLRFCPKGRYK